MFIMLGYDGETPRDVDATLEMLRGATPDRFFSTVAYPIRGTPYFARVADRLRTTLPWNRRTDRDWHVGGRRGGLYFRAARRYLESGVAAARLRATGRLSFRGLAHAALSRIARWTMSAAA